MANNPWNDAAERFKRQLDPADQKSLGLIETRAGLQDLINNLGRRSSALRDEKNVRLFNHVMELMDPIATVADALAPGVCVPSSSIWGAFGLIMEMTYSKREFIEAVLNQFKALFDAGPRMQEHLKDEELMQNKIVQSAIQEVFEESLKLATQCIKIFGKNESSTLNIVYKLKWIRYKKTLQRSLDRIKMLTGEVEIEIQKAVNQQVVRAARRYSHDPPQTPKNKVMIPFVKNPAFAGRTEYLKTIHRKISPTAMRESGEQQSLVLYGLAGIGKTQVALQYAHLYKGEHDACFWLTCDSRVKISKDVAEMARMLGLVDQGHEHNSAVVKEWLSNTDLSWLLVLDNVESSGDVQEIWPSCNRGSILVTTQDSGWRLREDIKHSIEIESMEDIDGVTMVNAAFAKHGKNISSKAAQRICRETGGSPFSIRQLSSYICANELDPDEFLDTYNSDYDIDSWDEAMLPSYQRTPSNFLDLTFTKLTDRDIALVSQFSFLDPDVVQPKLLFDSSRRNEFDTSMRKLIRYSLVSQVKGNSDRIYNIHRVVKRHLLSHLSDEQLGQAIDGLTRKLRSEFPRQTPWEDEVNNKKWIHSDLISHIVAINKEFERVSTLTSIPEVLAQNFLDGAFDLWLKGLLEEGIELINSAATLSSRHNFDDILTAEIISFLGTLRADSGEIEKAYVCFDEAHAIQKRRCMQIRAMGREPSFFDEIYLANSYNNLAGIHHAKGNYEEARIENEVAIFIKEKWRECQRREGRSLSHLLCLSYQNQATTLARQGQYDEATNMFEKALQEGRGEVSAARQGLTYHNYGCMKFEQGLIEDACRLLKSACEKREESLENHPDTAVSQHMLAVCYQKRNQGSKIENLKLSRELLYDAVRTLEMRFSMLVRKHLARTLFRLSSVLGDMKDPEEAAIRSRAVKVYFDVTGGKTPNGERSYDQLVPYI